MNNHRPKYEIILSAIRAGEEGDVEFKLADGQTYCWVENRLCHPIKVWFGGSSLDDEPDEIRYAEAPITFNQFVSLCDEIPDDEIAAIVMRTVLIKTAPKR
jgi:hypothetical protein